MSSIEFINHASFLYESDEFLFICDPWVEGGAFNDGWALLDKSTSNDQLVNRLSKTDKRLYIWYSHEHSDHFSISFLKKLKVTRPDAIFFFQKTIDKRVTTFLKKNKFSCKVLNNGEKANLGSNSWLSIRSWKSGDSLCVMNFNGKKIINLNDCIISTEKDCEYLRNILNNLGVQSIDILFTQFGYASWCGNENEVDHRKNVADEKLKRIAYQIKVLSPKNTILFASFVFFANEYNFYLNDQQNTPLKIRKSNYLKDLQDRIYFMKPRDKIYLDDKLTNVLASKTQLAEDHWQYLYSKTKPNLNIDSRYSVDDLMKNLKVYKSKIFKNFVGIFTLIEMIGIIKPLKVKILDHKKILLLSYKNSPMIVKDSSSWDITMTSSDLMFSIKNDFGFDCTHVNGRFRTNKINSENKFLYFSGPQNMLKNGFGWKKPIVTMKELLRLALR